MHVRETSVNDAYIETLDKVLSSGQYLDSRDGGCLEVRGYSLRLANAGGALVNVPVRKVCPHFAAAEFLWYLGGHDELSWLSPFASQYTRFATNGRLFGAYGPRWHQSFGPLEKHLKDKPETRQAVVPVFQASDLHVAMHLMSPDIPCTLSWQVFVRGGVLDMCVFMRSNDAWLGWPYDVHAHTCLQSLLAARMGLRIGTYHHHVGSMHIYERDFEKASHCVDAYSDMSASEKDRRDEISGNMTTTGFRLDPDGPSYSLLEYAGLMNRLLAVDPRLSGGFSFQGAQPNTSIAKLALLACSKWDKTLAKDTLPVYEDAIDNIRKEKECTC